MNPVTAFFIVFLLTAMNLQMYGYYSVGGPLGHITWLQLSLMSLLVGFSASTGEWWTNRRGRPVS